MSQLSERLVQVRESITSECSRLQRGEPTLIVITKNHPLAVAEELFALGERNFGENRVQEALPKFLEFSEQSGRADAKWHLVGQLQSNKVKQALQFTNTIHSLDRESLFHEIVKRSEGRDSPVEVFIQVNLTDDEQRGGVSLGETLGFADLIVQAPEVTLLGLMAVASLENEPKRDYEKVAKLSQSLQKTHPSANGLSIGMSGDYLAALEFGATHLRIGTAITGNRAI